MLCFLILFYFFIGSYEPRLKQGRPLKGTLETPLGQVHGQSMVYNDYDTNTQNQKHPQYVNSSFIDTRRSFQNIYMSLCRFNN